MTSIEKCFVNLCLIHSENVKYLEKGINGTKFITENDNLETKVKTIANGFYASGLEHYNVVKQFGRYPHRNDIIGRSTTPEEAKFLETSTYSFIKSVRRTD